MSYIVKKQTLFEKSAGDAYLAIYLEAVTADINYETGRQSFAVSLVADAHGLDFCALEGGNSLLNICGREFFFNDTLPLFDGYNLICSFTLDDLRTSDFNEVLPVRLTLNHRCNEVGLVGGIEVSVNMSVNKIYTEPELYPSLASYTLGRTVTLVGDFLSVGYDVYASVTVGGAEVCNIKIDENGRIPTSSEWMSSLPTSVSTMATVRLRAEFNGQPLPNEKSFNLYFSLVADECLPEFTVLAYPVSDNEAVREFGQAVKNKSAFHISAEEIFCKYGAVYEKCTITLDGVRYDGASQETPVLTEAGMHSYTVTLSDSRGFSASKSGKFEVLDYAVPMFSAEVVRVNENGEADLAGSGLFVAYQMENDFSFDGYNVYEHTVSLRRASNGEEVLSDELSEGDRVTFDGVLAGGVTYDVIITCRDSFGSVTMKTYVVESEGIELNIAKNKIGIGKIAENDNLFDCAWPIRVDGDITFTDEDGSVISLRALYKMITGQG